MIGLTHLANFFVAFVAQIFIVPPVRLRFSLLGFANFIQMRKSYVNQHSHTHSDPHSSSSHTVTLYLSGTHCTACKALIEEIVMGEHGVVSATVSLGDETMTLVMKGGENVDDLARRLTHAVSGHGYGVHTTRPTQERRTREWYIAVPLALVFLGAFWMLGEAGMVRVGGASDTALLTAFIVGLVASVSTCLAVVGGLLLSVSATYAREGESKKPQVLFHVGRLVGFAVLGGVLGALGDVFSIGFTGAAVLGGMAGVVMLILGLHLLEITPRVRVLTLPAFLGGAVSRVAGHVGGVAPLALGAATFFLPCGFTQSMQVLALSSGSVVAGALTMLMFALGTFPVLALISFGSLDLAKSRYRGVFFKVAGMVVIIFALMTLHNTLVFFDFISPLFTL